MKKLQNFLDEFYVKETTTEITVKERICCFLAYSQLYNLLIV